jgi:hypothetical protein
MEAVEKSMQEAKKREAEKAAKDVQAALEVKQMQLKLAAQKAEEEKKKLETISQQTNSQPSQPQIQVIV